MLDDALELRIFPEDGSDSFTKKFPVDGDIIATYEDETAYVHDYIDVGYVQWELA